MWTPTPLSKHLAGFDYDEKTSILVVTFKPKMHQYRYENVPAKLIKEFSIAPSKSVFFVQNIKNKFKTVRIC